MSLTRSRVALLISTVMLAAPAGAETLKVLAIRSAAPFIYEKDGRTMGIDYEMLDYFAKSRDATLQVKWAESFPEMLSRVEQGEADIAAGTITITPERARRMDFSVPYFPVQVMLVERMSDDTQSLTDLVGQRVGAEARTTSEDALKAVPGILIVTDGTLDENMRAIVRGEMRAAAADSSSIIPELDHFPSLKLGIGLGTESGFGFALPKNSPLTGPLNEHIKKLKQSGIYFRLVTNHMGPRASQIIRASK